MALSVRLTIRTPKLVTRIPARVTTLGDMTKQLKNPLVWIDCEMTGLDVAHDALIEVAVVITDANLTVVDPGIDILIQPSEEALNHMDDYVRNMLKDGIASMEEAESIVLDYIKKFVPVSGRALLAGNTVGMDRLFLSANMPRVIDHLHYRIIDVSSIKELAKRWYPCVYECSPEKHGGHRALADIRESIQELEYYRRALFPSDQGPSREDAQKIAGEVAALGIVEGAAQQN